MACSIESIRNQTAPSSCASARDRELARCRKSGKDDEHGLGPGTLRQRQWYPRSPTPVTNRRAAHGRPMGLSLPWQIRSLPSVIAMQQIPRMPAADQHRSALLDEAMDQTMKFTASRWVIFCSPRSHTAGLSFLGEHGHQHLGSGNLLAVRRLDVEHGTLNDSLKGRGRSGVVAVGVYETPKLVVQIIGNFFFSAPRSTLQAFITAEASGSRADPGKVCIVTRS